jgi:predicted enzyme related to lactoylglutathione lyase
MADETIRGQFIWHELLTTDTRAAAAFYPKVIPWRPQPYENSSDYTLWMSQDNSPRGGLMTLPQEAKAMGAPSNWLPYIGTPNVEATVRDAQRLGGRVYKEPIEAPKIGRWAVLADPQGAAFAVFTPAYEPKLGGKPLIGDFSWHELMTTDYQAALRFYQALFGWEKAEAHDMGPMGIYQMYGLSGRALGGMFNRGSEQQIIPPHWLCYVQVTDAAQVVKQATAAGGKVTHGPSQVPGGSWIAQILDPQGAAFAVVSMPAQPAKKPATPQKAAAPAGKAAARPAKATPKKKPKPRVKKAKPRAKTAVRRAGASKRKTTRKKPAQRSARKSRARRKTRR